MRQKPDIRAIAELAGRQRGLVTRADLHALDHSAVARLVRAGWLHRIHGGVFAVGHTALDFHARCLAATFALGPRAVMSFEPAGALWRVLEECEQLHVTVPTTAGLEHRPPVHVHRQLLRDDERCVRFGIPCTTLPRTLFDLAAVLGPHRFERVFETAQVRHKLQPSFMAAELLTRPGRRGNRVLRRVLADAVDPGEVESILELRFLALCEAYGLPRPRMQVGVGRWRIDFVFEDEGVAVETDGARWHATRSQRARDARKQADVERGDVLVVHLTWADVDERPAATAAMLHETLERARRRG